MNKRGLFARTAVGAVGGMMLIGMAGVAVADELGNDDVDVNVTIEALEPVGALTMSVAAESTSLVEVDSGDEEIRQFDGTLPTVTITDDREETPADQYWYVVGQSSAFSAEGVADLPAGHLGWVPELLSGDDEEVVAGDEVVTVLDEETQPGNNVGLEGEELFALATNATGELAPGSWSANAALSFKTPVDVAPGSYTGTITLTLWEDAIED